MGTESLLAGLVALVVGVGVGWFIERQLRGTAYKSREEILAQAQRDADAVKKAQELS